MTSGSYRAVARKADPFCCPWRDLIGLPPGHDPGDPFITDLAPCTASSAPSPSLKEHSERWPYHAPEYRPPQTCTIRFDD